MRKLALVLVLLLSVSFLTCSKKSPSEPTTFVLEVDNRTISNFDIYVDGDFAGESEANTVKEMGSYVCGENTYFEARYDTLTIFDTHQNTTGVQKYVMVLQM
jgi:hypothetical protein